MEIGDDVLEYFSMTEEQVRAKMAEVESIGLSKENRQVEFKSIELGPGGATAFIAADFKLVGLISDPTGEKPITAYFFRAGMSETEEEAYKLQTVLSDLQRDQYESDSGGEPEDALALFQQYYAKKHEDDDES